MSLAFELLIILFIVSFMCYIFGVFLSGLFNMSRWSDGIRLVITVLLFVVYIMIVTYTLEQYY